MGEHVPLPLPDAEVEYHDDTYVEVIEPPPQESPSSLPLQVRRSLREVLGDDGENVEQVWIDALESDNERIRVEAAKVLTQAAMQLSRNGSSAVGMRPLPKSVADVKLLTLTETYAAMIALYVAELERYLDGGGSEEEAIQTFREKHPEHEVPLALLRRALG